LDLYIHHLLPNTMVEPLSPTPEILSPDSHRSIIYRLVDTLKFEQWQLLTTIKIQFGPPNERNPTWDIESLSAFLNKPKNAFNIVDGFVDMFGTGVDTEYVHHVRYSPSKGLSNLLVRYYPLLLLFFIINNF